MSASRRTPGQRFRQDEVVAVHCQRGRTWSHSRSLGVLLLTSALASIACSVPEQGVPERPNPYLSFVEHVQAHDLDRLAGLYATDATYRDRTFDFEVTGRDAIREVLRSTMDGFGSPTFEVRRMVVDSAVVAVEWVLRGTFSTAILGVAPDSGAIELEGVSIGVVRDGLIQEHTDYLDRVALETRLGLKAGPGN